MSLESFIFIYPLDNMFRRADALRISMDREKCFATGTIH